MALSGPPWMVKKVLEQHKWIAQPQAPKRTSSWAPAPWSTVSLEWAEPGYPNACKTYSRSPVDLITPSCWKWHFLGPRFPGTVSHRKKSSKASHAELLTCPSTLDTSLLSWTSVSLLVRQSSAPSISMVQGCKFQKSNRKPWVRNLLVTSYLWMRVTDLCLWVQTTTLL